MVQQVPRETTRASRVFGISGQKVVVGHACCDRCASSGYRRFGWVAWSPSARDLVELGSGWGWEVAGACSLGRKGTGCRDQRARCRTDRASYEGWVSVPNQAIRPPAVPHQASWRSRATPGRLLVSVPHPARHTHTTNMGDRSLGLPSSPSVRTLGVCLSFNPSFGMQPWCRACRACSGAPLRRV